MTTQQSLWQMGLLKDSDKFFVCFFVANCDCWTQITSFDTQTLIALSDKVKNYELYGLKKFGIGIK